MKFRLGAAISGVAICFAGLNVCLAQDQAASPSIDDPPPVTFNEHVAPILFQKCSECHRPGEVAPFSLLSYADAAKRATMIRDVAAKRLMPPWKSVAGHAEFVGERRLTEDEIETFARWVEQGKPEGDAAALPPEPTFPDGWALGEPDIVLTLGAEFEVPADGPDVYRNFVFSLDVPDGKYIKAAEFRPSNRRVVHHAVLSVDRTDESRKRDDADPAPGYEGSGNPDGQIFPGCMATWTPGRDPVPLPDKLSMPWQQGADVVLQLHLHPSGKTEVERSSVGFYLTDEPPHRSMADLLLIDTKIDIPPGEKAYRTRAELTLPIDVELVGIFPHMHLIGRKFEVTAYPKEGEPRSLLRIDDWDFNWQTYYQYVAPTKLTAGTRVVMEAVHDNSAENDFNPNRPPKRVVWGEETTNEMSLAFLQVMPVREEEFDELGAGKRGNKLGVIRAEKKSGSP